MLLLARQVHHDVSHLGRCIAIGSHHCFQDLTAVAVRPSTVSARRDDSSSTHIVVKPAFTIAALTAVPVATGFSLPSSSSRSSSSSRELLDLLVLHPSGQLLLHRGCQPLINVNLTLPSSCLQQLTSTAAAAATAAGKQKQGLNAAAAAARGRPGSAGSLGCWSMSEAFTGGDESDDMLLSPGTPALNICINVK
jgi:hypothetical protein